MATLRRHTATRVAKKPTAKAAKPNPDRRKPLAPLQEWYIGEYLENDPEGKTLSQKQRLKVIARAYRAGNQSEPISDIPTFTDQWYNGFKSRYAKMDSEPGSETASQNADLDHVETPTDLPKMNTLCESIQPNMSPEMAEKLVSELKKQITMFTVERGIMEAKRSRLLDALDSDDSDEEVIELIPEPGSICMSGAEIHAQLKAIKEERKAKGLPPLPEDCKMRFKVPEF
ncbi:uncharacterized protein J8A68_001287 [[Candida] subhashii]|uniref:Uncharacterized protein n=1 Tax=[Candida] subhashii TaxID=561895 RepID=A0A8J5QRA8_9ASCO|nr:uncharacterized protein J8A68_001287 [[Candida] subhashii]KAG7665231.1 hypothetical protein J8A68_001287 [[Candida] subhashii]